MNIVKITDDTFKENVLSADGLVFVLFVADWCYASGKAIEVLQDVEDPNTLLKMDIDESPYQSINFGVRVIPQILAFHNGQLFDSATSSDADFKEFFISASFKSMKKAEAEKARRTHDSVGEESNRGNREENA